ncbi:hypothetical protein [Halalkalicoccus subterraneus]|uniref:hypothetical protein n=1 Tax=Halalkalicoccus subterraneus TaxID=2675002 RepID=UPI000EFCF15E|nr:hypothetical protein [Halalkalicoccus subterraneus]
MSILSGYGRREPFAEDRACAIRVARALALAAAGSALFAGVLIGVVTPWTSPVSPVGIGAVLGAIGFAWSSIALLISAVLAAASAA